MQRFLIRRCAAAVAAALGAATAHSQPAGLDEIVVTADFRQSNVADIPASVSVLDSAELAASTLQHFEEVVRQVPNLNLSGEGSRARYFQLRGVGELEQYEGSPNPSIGFIVDDIDFDAPGGPRLGRLASYIRDRRVPLEMCPSSNLQTHAVPDMDSIADHPIGPLKELGFRVTVNCDNRLMSGTSMSREMTLLAEAFDYDLDDLRWFTVNAMKSAFLPFDQRLDLINNVIKPAYAELNRA